jgi:hypothetical protein
METVARVVDFHSNRGFGTLVLENGETLRFDADICRHWPSAGEAVRVRLGPSRLGGVRVISVDGAVEPISRVRVSLWGKLLMLQDEDIALGLTDEIFTRMIGDLDDADVPLVELLAAFYADPDLGRTRAQADGFFMHDWRFEPGRVLEELCAIAGKRSLLRLTWVVDRADHHGGPDDPYQRLTVADARGRSWCFDARDLDDIVHEVNDALVEIGDERRFFAVDEETDWAAYLLATPGKAMRLQERQILPLTWV